MKTAIKENANEILKNYLKDHGITQHFVATKIGMTNQAFTNLMSGRARLTGDKAILISHVLDIPLSTFLKDEYKNTDGGRNKMAGLTLKGGDINGN